VFIATLFLGLAREIDTPTKTNTMTNDTYTVANTGATLTRDFNIDDRTEKGPVYSAASPNGDVAGRPTLALIQTKSAKGVMKTEARIKVPVQDADGVYSMHRTLYIGVLRSDLDDPADVEEELEALAVAFATGGFNTDLTHLCEGGK
jgi:hypothetical protein